MSADSSRPSIWHVLSTNRQETSSKSRLILLEDGDQEDVSGDDIEQQSKSSEFFAVLIGDLGTTFSLPNCSKSFSSDLLESLPVPTQLRSCRSAISSSRVLSLES